MAKRNPKASKVPKESKTSRSAKKVQGKKKKPRIETDPSANDLKTLLISFSIVERHGKYGFEKLFCKEKLWEIIDKTKEMEKLTWEQLGQNGSHNVSTENFCKEARQELRRIGLGDLEEMYSLRFSAKERIYGLKENRVLKIMWWDPNHAIYPVKKKNT